jgi:endonuclease/exonuclease/phosphatase family metal-dependent hydrolase
VKKFLSKITDLVNAIAIAVLLISYLAPYIDPVDFWPVSFFGLFYKPILVLNILLIILWIVRGKRRWMYNAFFILIGFQFMARNIQYNDSSYSPDDLKICTFNTNVQQVYNGGNTSKEISEYLSAKEYDVAVLIEWLDKKGSINSKAYPHQQFVRLESKHNPYDYGIRIASKHRIINWERVKYDHFTNNITAYFDIDIDGTVIRFVATHLQSNGISSKDYHRLVNVEVGDEEYKNYALNFAKRLKTLIIRRSNQTKTVLEAIEGSPYPVIVLGDFNDTPQSYTYQSLKKRRKDAFIEKGNGWGATYLKPVPLMRIDYILHDEELSCTSYKCISDIKSDHALLEASFKIP